MRTRDTAQFDTLARETAATVRATVRRWWLNGKDRPVLHIEAERTFVGARPVVVHFSVPLGKTRLPTANRPPQMEIGAPALPAPKKTRTTRQKVRPAARKTRATATKTRSAARKTRATATKTRAAATKARPAARKARPARRANVSHQPRQQQQKRAHSTSKKPRRASSRR